MTANGYTQTARVLHWLVAGLIVLQYILANLADAADSRVGTLVLLANHKSVGMTILALAIARLAWRARFPAPPLPSGMARWQVVGSHVSHWGLYGLLIAMPVTGWLMSSASNYPVSWFNLVQLPDLVAANEASADRLESVHETLASVLAALAGLHVLAAFKHALIDRDGLLARMSSAVSVSLFAFVIVAGAFVLGNPGAAQDVAAADEPSATADGPSATADSAPAAWDIDYAASFIVFRAEQAGAEFEGRWPAWQATLRFSPDRLADSVFDVRIDTGKVSTGDSERDAVLAEPEWFDAGEYPEASYRASKFLSLGGGRYAADGELRVKDVATPVALLFSVEEAAGGRRILTGTATIDRLAAGIGTGEWTDTTWVGQEVSVEVRVEASVPDSGGR